MNHTVQFEHAKPNAPLCGDATDRPWVIVLSEWREHGQKLVQRIQGAFGEGGSSRQLPTVLVVDDVGGRDAEHRRQLAALTHAGAFVLEPEDEKERGFVPTSPLAFAARQLALATEAPLTGGSLLCSAPPAIPDGYQEFAKAVTPLSDKDLTDVIEGRRSDDWRYEI